MNKLLISTLCLFAFSLSASASWQKISDGIYYDGYVENNNGFTCKYKYTDEFAPLKMLFQSTGKGITSYESTVNVNCVSGTYSVSDIKYYDASGKIVHSVPVGESGNVDSKPEMKVYCSVKNRS